MSSEGARHYRDDADTGAAVFGKQCGNEISRVDTEQTEIMSVLVMCSLSSCLLLFLSGFSIESFYFPLNLGGRTT